MANSSAGSRERSSENICGRAEKAESLPHVEESTTNFLSPMSSASLNSSRRCLAWSMESNTGSPSTSVWQRSPNTRASSSETNPTMRGRLVPGPSSSQFECAVFAPATDRTLLCPTPWESMMMGALISGNGSSALSMRARSYVSGTAFFQGTKGSPLLFMASSSSFEKTDRGSDTVKRT